MKPKRKPTNPIETAPSTPALEEEDAVRARPDGYQYPSNPELGLFRTEAEVAVFFQVSRRTVCSWIAAGAPGKWSCGRYDVVEIRAWLQGKPLSPFFRKKG